LSAPSAAAVISGNAASANQVVLQRAQRTVRPAEPSEADSIVYEVEQFGQTISMGRGLLEVQTYQPSVNGSETMITPRSWTNW
jgi:hypothetical protein